VTRIVCPRAILFETIARLRNGGLQRKERVVLWLGKVSAAPPEPVAEVYEPEQITAIDYFRLPPPSMRALMAHLRTRRLKILAQLHTHPGRAYHSEVDDEWAIVRHVGALSLVLPRFAATTTVENFLVQAMTYELSPTNEWLHVPNHGPSGRIEIR
jgi:proteasome lid subunit RPN8/RPN11